MDEHERQHWLSGLPADDDDNQLVAMAIMCAYGKPRSWLDVGCGTGAMIKLAHLVGVHALGADQIADPNAYNFVTCDLTQPLDLQETFQMVTSIEMVEHLPEQYEGVISDTLVRHVAPDGYLVLSAAKPGQGGFNHFNCQPKKYWCDRMESRGLHYSQTDTIRLVEILKFTFTKLNHLKENIQVFRR